jgi:hypothetical protein
MKKMLCRKRARRVREGRAWRVTRQRVPLDTITRISAREAKVATNKIGIVLVLEHTLLARRRGRSKAIDALARTDTKLAAAVDHGCACIATDPGRLFAAEKRVGATGGRCVFVGDAGPDGRERQEDADGGEGHGGELWNADAELEDGEDG